MKKYCKDCNVPLELVIAGYDIYSTDHLICPICNGTYNVEEQICECKYAHPSGIICKYPTLEGRLNHPLTTEKEALLQLYRIGGSELSDAALKKIEKYLEEDKKLQESVKKL